MTTILDIQPGATFEGAGDVTIREGESDNECVLESDDPLALIMAVCIAINNGGVDFVSGTETTATLRRKGQRNS